MLCIQPGEHGSTYGGNPLGVKVAMEALKVIVDEKLSENSLRLGEIMRTELSTIPKDKVELVRGKGLFFAIVICEKGDYNAWNICMKMKEKGVLAKPTHGNIIRLAPPLVITESELMECLKIIKEVLMQ